MTLLAHIADRALNRPLLITPDKAAVIVGVLSGRIGLGSPDASRFEGEQPLQVDDQGRAKTGRYGEAAREPFLLSSGVGIITITGSLVNRGAWIGASSGLTSYEGIQHQLKRAGAHADVKAVLLDIHSPGGEAVGAFETAAMVRELAREKPTVAVVNGMAASAAYAIASGAREIVTTESGISGSIGVVWLHADFSRQLENEGVKPTFIFAGKHKVDGHPFGPLPDEVRADFQAEIDAVYAQFLNTVAAGRGARLTDSAARATEARVFAGAAAVAVGLADRVGTFESVLQGLSRAEGRTPSQKGRSMSENTGASAADPNAGTPPQATGGITKADLDAAVAKATTDAQAGFEAKLKADRERMAALDELAAECAGNADGLAIVAKAKSEGTSPEAAALQLVKAGVFKKAAVLGALQEDDKSASGAAPAASATGAGKAAVPQTEAGWKAEYEGSADLQGEFLSAEAYVAFKRDELKKGGAK